MIRCIACDRAGSHELALRFGEHRVMRCEGCGHFFLRDWAAELARVAETYDYYADRVGRPLADRRRPANTAAQHRLLAGIERTIPAGRLLDVGCGEGHLLATAVDRGWDGLGIDLSESAVAICQSDGVNAERVDFFGRELSGPFDLIVMSELIEHVPDPGAWFERAYGLLAPGGGLYCTTPNFDSLSRRVLGGEWRAFGPQHVSYFTPTGLASLARRRSGLRVRRLESRNLSFRALRRLVRRGSTAATPPRAGGRRVGGSSRRAQDQRMRALLARLPGGELGKELLNRIVSRAGLGDTIVALLERPRG